MTTRKEKIRKQAVRYTGVDKEDDIVITSYEDAFIDGMKDMIHFLRNKGYLNKDILEIMIEYNSTSI